MDYTSRPGGLTGCRVGGEGPQSVSDLRAGAPLLRAIRKGGTLAEATVTGDRLYVMVKHRAATAGSPGAQ